MMRQRRNNLFYYAIFLPAFLVILFLTIYPVFSVLFNSLFRYNFLAAEKSFLGLQNFVRILREQIFRKAFLNTLIFSLTATAVEASLGVFLALLFYGKYPGKRVTMITVIFPMMLSTMVICAIWKTMYHYEIGIINHLLTSIGVPRLGWLISKKMALTSVIIVDVWQWTPFAFIIVQAGLNSVPHELFEAASIDGAGYLSTVFHITFPILADQILLVFLLRTIDTFRIFDKVYALTQGGPGNATETVSYFIYREGFSFFNLGRASAAAVYTLIVIALIASFYIRSILKKEA
jgi:multiple sugar transport system permease protein